ncbi:MAG: glutamate 5-kinase [Ornithinimicrobium sp.]
MTDALSTIRDARRVVVKVGSSSVTAPQGGIDTYRLQQLSSVIAKRWLEGVQVVLVSSGAIAAGMTALGLIRRPKDLATQQAAASAGQGGLVAAYSEAFRQDGLSVGQVLLTASDMHRRSHYTNASRTLERLLKLGVVPVINENDTVATREIRFGDNDHLAAMVAHLVDADALVLLSDVDALYDADPRKPSSSRIPVVSDPAQITNVDITAAGSRVGTGGMVTKVAAARMVTAEGIPALLGSADQAARILDGEDVGTLFLPTGNPRSARLRWLAHASQVAGRLTLDHSAVEAVMLRQTPLLPVALTRVEGAFQVGNTVDLCDPAGRVVARGKVSYDASELDSLIGDRRPSPTTHRAYGRGRTGTRIVIRRDNLVVL